MNNPFSALPSYVKESPKFERFLELVNGYLVSGALNVALFKDSFISEKKPNFVIQALAKQLNVDVELPFKDGVPDWNSYYKQLLMAYRAKCFNITFHGRAVDFVTGDPLRDVATVVVIDFSVAEENQSDMSVVYSVMSMDDNLTINIVRDNLIPRVTGVNSSLYYLQFGQEVFGYDIDEKEGIRMGPDHQNPVAITEDKYSVLSATINAIGSGYAVGDIVTTVAKTATGADGKAYSYGGDIQLKIVDYEGGAFLELVEPSKTYKYDPTGTGFLVTGGSGSGLTVDIVGGANKGYFIRGWDNGSFISITRN